MTIDWSLTLGALVAIAASGLGVYVALRVRFALTEKKAADAFDIAKAARDSLSEYKLHVAQGYVSLNHLEKVEGRLIAAINNMADELKGLRRELIENLRGQRDDA